MPVFTDSWPNAVSLLCCKNPDFLKLKYIYIFRFYLGSQSWFIILIPGTIAMQGPFWKFSSCSLPCRFSPLLPETIRNSKERNIHCVFQDCAFQLYFKHHPTLPFLTLCHNWIITVPPPKCYGDLFFSCGIIAAVYFSYAHYLVVSYMRTVSMHMVFRFKVKAHCKSS